MRLWSLDFSYLDSRGITACWRESLLARKVLEGNTRGYKNHPQLRRFMGIEKPLVGINTYLYYIYESAVSRGFSFEAGKINEDLIDRNLQIEVKTGQLIYEFELLRMKLRTRDIRRLTYLDQISHPLTNPIFVEIRGWVEDWEVVREDIVSIIKQKYNIAALEGRE